MGPCPLRRGGCAEADYCHQGRALFLGISHRGGGLIRSKAEDEGLFCFRRHFDKICHDFSKIISNSIPGSGCERLEILKRKENQGQGFEKHCG